MRRFLVIPLLIAAAPADRLPLAHGIFVASESPCRGASNVEIISYWGGDNALNVAQAEYIVKSLRHSGNRWTIRRHCTSIHDDDLGEDTITLTIAGPKAFTLDKIPYRWCGTKVQF